MRRLNAELPKLGLRPRNILDAGVEDAAFVYWLADRYPEATVTAVDIDDAAMAACLAARPKKYQNRVNFRVGRFADLEPDSFDLITAVDILEHIADDEAAVGELARAITPGGHVLVHVPRDRWLTRSGTVHAVADEDAWRINIGHVRQGYSPEAMRTLLEGGGLVVLDVQTWLGRWGTFAHEFYQRVERPTPLRLLSLPVTDVCAALDRRGGTPEGNAVYARAVRPRSLG